MSNLLDEDLDSKMTELRLLKTKLIREIDSCDTELIGLKLEKAKRQEIQRSEIQHQRDSQHGLVPFVE